MQMPSFGLRDPDELDLPGLALDGVSCYSRASVTGVTGGVKGVDEGRAPSPSYTLERAFGYGYSSFSKRAFAAVSAISDRRSGLRFATRLVPPLDSPCLAPRRAPG